MLANVSAFGQHGRRDVAAETIRLLDRKWAQAAGAHDLKATLAFYSDDAIVLGPNAPTATTKAAIRALWAPLCAKTTTISWKATKVEVSFSGDMAYSLGTYQLTMIDHGKKISDHGKFMEVWRKLPGGKWKAVADTWNTDLP